MRTTTRRTARTGGLAALALTLSLGLAACGDSDDDADTTANETTTSETPADEMESESPMESPSDDAAAGDPAAAVFGEACSALPAEGDGSLGTMAEQPVATAASGNPLLQTLVTAVGEADLVDTLNNAEALTVFAPTNDAFAEIPKKDLNALLKDKEALTQVLTHHVVEGQLGPDEVGGEHTTLNGDTIEVMGEGEMWTVGDEEAAVLCGNVPTANATVYVIDSVLMP
ncbi:fasciclin domain-containing protein [Nocardioides solisilvae]|uniref:fasciclin domain-containing protein n=1 Tax=Nocardioides solisilvae TaxID=1542435 RepID=UPI000D740290|nr:fasciclin domain-containing protein [Nocardioides solisilvae]